MGRFVSVRFRLGDVNLLIKLGYTRYLAGCSGFVARGRCIEDRLQDR